MSYKKKPLLIVFDGIDGCGKSTQSKKFNTLLNDIGIKSNHVFFPGYTELGKNIRNSLLNYEFKDIQGQALAFGIDRYLTYHNSIKGFLNDEKSFVVSDRYDSSTYCYQGKDITNQLNIIGKIPEADLYIIIDISAEVALSRINNRGELNSFEKNIFKNNIDKVLNNYKTLERKNVIHINGNKSEMEVSDEINLKIVDFLFKNKNLLEYRKLKKYLKDNK